MRYNELMEVTDEYEMKQAHMYARKIRIDCEHYLRSKNVGSNLIRGDSHTGQKYVAWDQDFTVMRDKERIYSDSYVTQLVHDYLDDEGFKATRLRGKFTYKDADINSIDAGVKQSKWFGKPFAVFPVGTNWEIMYMDDLGGDGDYGNDRFIELAREEYQEFNELSDDEFIENYPGDETVMQWYLDVMGENIFHKGQNIEAVANKHEAVLYSPKVHMVDASLFASREVQETLYRGIK